MCGQANFKYACGLKILMEPAGCDKHSVGASMCTTPKPLDAIFENPCPECTQRGRAFHPSYEDIQNTAAASGDDGPWDKRFVAAMANTTYNLPARLTFDGQLHVPLNLHAWKEKNVPEGWSCMWDEFLNQNVWTRVDPHTDPPTTRSFITPTSASPITPRNLSSFPDPRASFLKRASYLAFQELNATLDQDCTPTGRPTTLSFNIQADSSFRTLGNTVTTTQPSTAAPRTSLPRPNPTARGTRLPRRSATTNGFPTIEEMDEQIDNHFDIQTRK